MAKAKIIEESELDPWKLFLNAMRAPMTRDRYQTRVAKFFDFIGILGKTLEHKAKTFAKKGKIDTNWALSNILKFVYFQKELVKNFKSIEERYPNLDTTQKYSEENVKQIVHEVLQELKQKDLKRKQS